jgi:hypothetical protein
MSEYRISYKYKKKTDASYTSTRDSVNAEAEATAIRIVENKHPDCDVLIVSIERKN